MLGIKWKALSFGKNRYKIDFQYCNIGDDLLIVVTGGDEHIGAVSLMDNNNYSSLSKIGHKDEIISKFVAHSISTLFKKDIVVVCGIHINDATEEDIVILMQNANSCVKKFLLLYEG